MLPFTLKIDKGIIEFYHKNMNIDAEIVSNTIMLLNSDVYNSQSCWDFITPIYDLEERNTNFWVFFSHLLNCD